MIRTASNIEELSSYGCKGKNANQPFITTLFRAHVISKMLVPATSPAVMQPLMMPTFWPSAKETIEETAGSFIGANKRVCNKQS